MKDYTGIRKRVVAVLMCLAMTGTTMASDFSVYAEEIAAESSSESSSSESSSSELSGSESSSSESAPAESVSAESAPVESAPVESAPVESVTQEGEQPAGDVAPVTEGQPGAEVVPGTETAPRTEGVAGEQPGLDAQGAQEIIDGAMTTADDIINQVDSELKEDLVEETPKTDGELPVDPATGLQYDLESGYFFDPNTNDWIPMTEEQKAELLALSKVEEQEEVLVEEVVEEAEKSHETVVNTGELSYEYKLNEDGSLVFDESGNPIVLKAYDKDGKLLEKVPTIHYQRDEAGNLILSEQGFPIVIPEEVVLEVIAEEIPEEVVCEHDNVIYRCNEDGTHTVLCKECKEILRTEDCTYDETRTCELCGYELEIQLEEQTFEKKFGRNTVTVSGLLPVNGTVEIIKQGNDEYEELINEALDDGEFKAVLVVDITIYDEFGNEYQPKDDDNTVKVTFSGPDFDEDSQIVHIKNANVEFMDSDAGDAEVATDAEEFSSYAAGTIDSSPVYTVDEIATRGTVSCDSGKCFSVQKALVEVHVPEGYSVGDEYASAAVYRCNSTEYPNKGEKITNSKATIVSIEGEWATISATFDTSDVKAKLENGASYGIVFSFYEESAVKCRDSGEWPVITPDGENQSEKNAIVPTLEGPKDLPTITPIVSSEKFGAISFNSTPTLYYFEGQSNDKFIAKTDEGVRVKAYIDDNADASGTYNGQELTLDLGKNLSSGDHNIKFVAGATEKTLNIKVYEYKLEYKGAQSGSGFEFQYDADGVKPTVVVDGESVSNYKYPSDLNVGDKELTCDFKGKKYKLPYKITEKEITWEDFGDQTIVNVSSQGVVAVENAKIDASQYTASVESKVKISSTEYKYSIKFVGRNNYKESFPKNFIKSASDLNLSDVLDITWKETDASGNKSVTYTGGIHNFTANDFNIFADGAEVFESADYGLEFNTTAVDATGDAVVKITSNKGYKGEITLGYEIKRLSLSLGSVSVIPEKTSYIFTGDSIKPSVTVKYGDKVINPENYSISYENNIYGNATVKVTGKKNCKDSNSANFSIDYGFKNFNISLKKKEFVYNGEVQSLKESDIAVRYNDTDLSRQDSATSTNSGYYVEFKDADGSALSANAGTKKIICYGTGVYKDQGTIEATYEVKPAPLSKATFEWKELSSGEKTYKYTGETIKPSNDDFTLKYKLKEEVPLTAGSDFTTSSTTSADAGDKELTIEGKGNYQGTIKETFKVVPVDISKINEATVSFAEDVSKITYTGEEKKPKVVVTVGDKVFEEGENTFKCTYMNNISVGRAKVTVTGANKNLTGSKVLEFDIKTYASSFTFRVSTKDEEYECEGGDLLCGSKVYEPYYTGTAIKPVLSIYAGATKLERGTDFSVSYADNINPTTGETARATIHVNFKGANYAGKTADVTFKIQKATIDNAVVTNGDSAEFNYPSTTEDVIKNSIKVKLGDKELVKGTDYTITVAGDPSKAGEDTDKVITITGNGNYSGEKKVSYTIGKDISSATISVKNPWSGEFEEIDKSKQNEYYYSGSALTSTLKLGESILTKDTDYTATDVASVSGLVEETKYNSVNGTNLITTTFTGNGTNYYGSTSFSYRILPISLKATYTPEGQSSGKALFSISAEGVHKSGDGDDRYLYYQGGKDIDVKPIVENVRDHIRLSDSDYIVKPAAISGKVSNEKQEVEVKGTGNYKDSLFLYLCVDKGLINVEFTDAGKSKYLPSDPTGEKDKTIELQSDKLYCTGQPFTLSDFDVRCDGVDTALKAGTDYEAVYANNEQPGEATLTITGKGSYTGTVTIKYTIQNKIFSADTISAQLPSIVYDGNKHEPGSTEFDVYYGQGKNRTKLIYDKDYVISGYGDNTYPGKADNFVKVKGKGVYADDEVDLPFNIVLDITGCARYVGDASTPENTDFTNQLAKIKIGKKKFLVGEVVEPTISYLSKDKTSEFELTEKLEGADNYKVTKAKNSDGTYKVTFTGQNFAKGSVTYDGVQFVTKLDPTAIKLRQTAFNYKNGAIRPGRDDISGLSGTLGQDYTLKYYKKNEIGGAECEPIAVGDYVVRVAATEGSSYYKADEYVDLDYKIVYNLDDSVVVLLDSTTDTAPANLAYVPGGVKISMGKQTGFPYYLKVTCHDVDISEYCTVDGASSKTIDGVGNFTVTVNKKNEATDVYGSQKKFSFKVNGKSLADAEITLDAYSFEFTGDAIKPVETVKDGESTLVKGKDYEVTYESNVNASDTAPKVVIKGIGAYKNDDVKREIEFDITPADITKASVKVAQCTYAGKKKNESGVLLDIPLYPEVTASYNGGSKTYTLKPGADYDLTYVSNAESSAYQSTREPATHPYVKLTGKGNFTGVIEDQEFTIDQIHIDSSAAVKVTKNEAVYTGEVIDMTQGLELKVGEYLLTQGAESTGADYDVVIYKGNVKQESGVQDVGEYTLVITGQNNCTGVISSVKFYVRPRNIARLLSEKNLEVNVADVPEYTEGEVTPEVTITDKTVVPNNKVLEKDTDFTVTVKNNNKSTTGEYSKEKDEFGNLLPKEDSPYVEITGKEGSNYTGTVKIPFSIGKSLPELLKKGEADGEWVTLYYDGDKTKLYNGDDKDAYNYHYNADAQKLTPTVVLHKSGEKDKNLSSVSDYEIYYENDDGDEDDCVNAGVKNLCIRGIGSYCGIIKQPYTIFRKDGTHEADITGDDLGGAFGREEVFKTKPAVDGKPADLTFDMKGMSRIKTVEEAKNLLRITDDTEAAKYVGFRYAIYDGQPVEPKVEVWDNTLGKTGKVKKQIPADQLKFEYSAQDEASIFDPARGIETLSSVKITFKNGDETSGSGNYYADPNKYYAIKYIVVPGEISDDFDVVFADTLDQDICTWDGKEQTPAIKVFDKHKQLLTEDEDYTVEYNDNINPGPASLTVTGKGNYRGTKTKKFKIVCDIDKATVCYLNDEGEIEPVDPARGFVQKYVTSKYEEPQIFLRLESPYAAEPVDLKYWKVTDKKIVGRESSPDYKYLEKPRFPDAEFPENAVITYLGNTEYYLGEKTIEYTVEFDPDQIDVVNYLPEYYYTKEAIEPDFKLNVEEKNTEITDISYFRNGVPTDDLASVGEITAEISYKLAGEDVPIPKEVTYSIIPRPFTEDLITFVYSKSERYKNKQVTPSTLAYLTDYSDHTREPQIDMNTGKAVFLEEGVDYEVSYGENLLGKNAGSITFKSINQGNFVGGPVTVTFDILPGRVRNLTLEPTGKEAGKDTLTATWVNDAHADGVVLELKKVNQDGTLTHVKTEQLGKEFTEWKFKELESVTKYRVFAISYVAKGTDIVKSGKSEDSPYAEAVTEMGKNTLEVTCTGPGKVLVKWSPTDAVTTYKVYRALTPTEKGTKVASIPVSLGQYTNNTLTSGSDYYYYVEGYAVVDGKSTKINESEHIKVHIN